MTSLLDPAHMIKIIRNLVADVENLVDKDNCQINFRYIEMLNTFQTNEGLHLANKLRNKHIHFQSQKMKVNNAAQTLSNSVAKAFLFLKNELKIIEFQNVDATVQFIKVVDTTFDMLNSVNIYATGYKKPITKSNKDYIIKNLTDAIDYFYNLKLSNGQFVINSRRKTPVLGFILDCLNLLAKNLV